MEDARTQELLRMRFPRRINISLALSPGVDRMVRRLNHCIVTAGFAEISFLPGSAHIPHVTLLMGEVQDEDDYSQLIERCGEFARSAVRFEYKTSCPYLKPPSKHFVFMDTLPQELFRHFRRALHERVGAFLECEHYGGPDNPSHVTVGYANPYYPGLTALKREYRERTGKAERMQVCHAGNRGTCIELLHTVELA